MKSVQNIYAEAMLEAKGISGSGHTKVYIGCKAEYVAQRAGRLNRRSLWSGCKGSYKSIGERLIN